tara:strand:+ start:1812 stop:2060 length:249 start_codon:yes stop_codon:yes gene_type:complete
MYKELIKIGQKNLQHLKSCMNICEAQLWGGPRYIKQKYLQQLSRLKVKMKEEQFYIDYYTDKINEKENIRKKIRETINLVTG